MVECAPKKQHQETQTKHQTILKIGDQEIGMPLIFVIIGVRIDNHFDAKKEVKNIGKCTHRLPDDAVDKLKFAYIGFRCRIPTQRIPKTRMFVPIIQRVINQNKQQTRNNRDAFFVNKLRGITRCIVNVIHASE